MAKVAAVALADGLYAKCLSNCQPATALLTPWASWKSICSGWFISIAAWFGRLRFSSISLFEQRDREGRKYLRDGPTNWPLSLGYFSNASAPWSPSWSLRRLDGDVPWSQFCRRPWLLMHLTAHGRALPCCIAPFSMRGYENFTLGDARTAPLRQIWNGAEYQSFREALMSDRPPQSCAGCGLRWSL